MTIKSIRVLSLAKILAAIYAGLGLIFGVLFAGLSLIGGLAPMAAQGEAAPAIIGLVMGGGAIIAMPIFYGLMGFIGGLVVAALYNLVARYVGGLELEVE